MTTGTAPTTHKPSSPLRELRLAAGLDASTFCRLVGCDLAQVYGVEVGTRRPGERYRRVLRAMGIDPEPLLQQHAEWCRQQSATLADGVGAQVRQAAEAMAPAGGE
ncbi:MAG: helix-turn-helix domain-containing protein [Armatimonadetes bacterium]|nr:helix-turn-helix domain-containing protein [Armatimonadota bacterium]